MPGDLPQVTTRSFFHSKRRPSHYSQSFALKPRQYVRKFTGCNLLGFFSFLKKDAYKYQQFNTSLEMPKSSPHKQFSLRGHTTKNRSEVWWKQWIKESSHLRSDFQKTPVFPGVSLCCHPAQHLSNIVIAPLPHRGADSTCCTAGAGRPAGRGRQEPERHRRSVFPTQMQSRALSAREVCSLVRFNIKMWQAPYIQEDKWYAKSILFVLTSVQRENSWDKAVAF